MRSAPASFKTGPRARRLLILLVGLSLLTACSDTATTTTTTATTTTQAATTTEMAATTTTPPTTTEAPTTTTALTTTTAVPGIVAVSIPAGSTYLGVGDPLVAVSAGEAWAAMGSEGGPAALIGHLEDGAWAHWQLTTEGTVRALAEAPDGTVWAATDLGVFSFDGVEWTRRFDGRATGVTVGEDGTVWITDGLSLVRWDGESWDEVALSPEEMSGWSVDMAVLPGGEVWMTAAVYFCATSPLMRYDGATLEAVEVTGRPGGGSYAYVVEAAPNGDLWVAGLLGPNPGSSHVPGELALARFDGVSWTVYDWPLPTPIEGVDCFADMLDMAVAPDGVVWLASVFGLGSFDGTNGTPYIEGDSGENWVFKVDVAPDGTVWYKDDQLHTLSTP